jgi:lipoyl(octanoyl) transferase
LVRLKYFALVIFSALTLYVDDIPHDGPLNMAIDEVLARGSVTPLLRVYRWSDAVVSFGYFGEFAAAAERWPARPLVRRWTGGGEVPHGNDFTYTLIVPRSEAFSRIPVRQSYHRIHEILARAIPGASLAESDDTANAACFARPVIADVMKNGMKVAGAAQRRGSFGLLHQGSIQGTIWPATLAQQFAASLAPTWNRESLRSGVFTQASVLAREKYATDEWLQRR